LHDSHLDGATEIFADALKIFARQPTNFGGGFFLAEAHRQIPHRHAPMPRIKVIDETAKKSAHARHALERQQLDHAHDQVDEAIERRVHRSSEADFAHAILKIFRATEDFYFHTHEVNGQVASIELREPHGI